MALRILLVFLGSGVGGVLRYVLGGAILAWTGPGFPYGTLAVNVLGCTAAGLLTATLVGAAPMREELRIALLVGLLGGFTTFSTFGRETLGLVGAGQLRAAALYVVLSNIGGLTGCWAGFSLGKRLIA